jgi:very-short-patch-repair endonuclease
MDVDRKVERVATQQQGNIAHDQLLTAGVGRRAVTNWVARGRLIPRHRGVYVLGHMALPEFSDEMAAVLACRPRSLVCGHSAAQMWGFRPKPDDGVVDVLVVGRDARDRPGIRVHRTAWLAKADLDFIDDIPVTSPARAILEIAPDLDFRELELAVHEALALKIVTIPKLRAVLARYPRRSGSALLQELAVPSTHSTITDSKGAELLHRHLRRSGLPEARGDHRIDRWRLDFYWPEAGLVVEVDGGDFHSSRPRIERDHRKDAELRNRGIEVLRFTGRQIVREIEFVLVAIARAYERRLRKRASRGPLAVAQ